MKIFIRILSLLLFPNKLARFCIVLYRLKEFRIKIDNPARLCMYKLSCSRYAYRAFDNFNFFYALYLTWQRYYSCTPLRFNKELDIDVKKIFDKK